MAALDNRVVLITGAARGLGLEVARQLAGGGATVLLSARTAEQARAGADELSSAGDVRALPVDLDITQAHAAVAAVRAVDLATGRLDILSNNAAAYVDWSELASSADLAQAERVLATNLFGAWRLIQALLPMLRQSPHPRIVNVSSGAGSHGDQDFGLTAEGAPPRPTGSAKPRSTRSPAPRRGICRDAHHHQLGVSRLDRYVARSRADGRPADS